MGGKKCPGNRFPAGFFVLLILFTSYTLTDAQIVEKKEGAGSYWPFAAYNFGSLGKRSPEAQIDLLKSTGYNGIILSCETKEDFENLDKYNEKAAKIKDFKIEAVFERYNFTDSTSRKDRWRKVVDMIAGKGTQLWIIFGKKTDGITDGFIEAKLREIVNYAAQRGVHVVLYPHSKCYIATAEEAMPFVEKIDHPNLKLAVHLCHEIRAGNGSRMAEIFDRVKARIGAVTLAGTDSIADFSNPRNMDSSTIKPLGQGNYPLDRFVGPMIKSGYKGTVGFINFKIEEEPENYLGASLKVWRNISEIAKNKAEL
jgi:sugar phosphate isomerase/epimerase